MPTSGTIALQNLQNGALLQAAGRVLVNGAAGGVGSIAVQLAKAFGAHVTAVDGTRKQAFLSDLGADRVVDYTREDCTRLDGRYDLILDVASNLTLADCKRALEPAGRLVVIGHDHDGTASGRTFGSMPRMAGLMAASPLVRQLPKPTIRLPSKKAVIGALSRHLADGTLTPTIAHSYALDEVPQALRHLQSGQALGRIVVTP